MTTVQNVKAPVALVRVVGIAIGLVGLALLALAAFLVLAQIQMQGHLDTEASAFVAVLFPIIWFCLNAGIRFVLGLPSPDNSLLSWSGWRSLAIYIVAVTTWLLILGVRSNLYAGLIALAIGGTASKLCWDRSTTLRGQGSSDAAL